MRINLLVVAVLTAVGYMSAPSAMADDWHHHDDHHGDHHDDHRYDRHDVPVIRTPVIQSGVPGHPNWDYGHQKKWELHQEAVVRHDIKQNQRIEAATQRRHYNNWNDERNQYQSNLRRLNVQQQLSYDAEMRRQWLAYHHGSWNGQYNWNNYSDPGFLDYLHSNQPSLLGRIGGVLGL